MIKRKSFLSGDNHFGHERIITICNRPFSSLEEMNETMIANWNARVGPDDIVYHVGDFGMGPEMPKIFERLNGEKHLVWGNHDDEIVKGMAWASVSKDAEVMMDHQRVYLRHWPALSWDNIKRSIHAYGHTHGNIAGWDRACDVGVDCWEFKPITVQEMMKRLRKLPPNPFYVNEVTEEAEPDAPAPGM